MWQREGGKEGLTATMAVPSNSFTGNTNYRLIVVAGSLT